MNMFKNTKIRLILAFLLPVALVVLLIWFFVQKGTFGVLEGNFPPVEKIFFERVVFEPELVTLKILNDGPEVVEISQLIVNDVVWRFEMYPSFKLEPLGRADVSLYYPWVEGDPLAFKLVSINGVAFEKEVEVSFLSPVPDTRYIKTFVLLGFYVGVFPVLLGLLWFPFLRKLKGGVYMFLLSLTVGLLIFLGFDALAEAIELIVGGPTVIGSLIGGFAYSPVFAILFLAIGVGAIFDVSFDILNHIARRNERGLFTTVNVLGFLAGLMVMYGTGFLVLG